METHFELKRVHFIYPGTDEAPSSCLLNLTFEIKSGWKNSQTIGAQAHVNTPLIIGHKGGTTRNGVMVR